MTQRWFLHHRITFAFGLTTLLLSLALSVPFGWIVYRVVEEEIDALAREELDETRAYFLDRRPSVEEFAHVAGQMQSEHPDNPMAWRIHEASSGRTWGEFGRTALLASLPDPLRAGHGVGPIDGATRYGIMPLSGGLSATIVLQATAQTTRLTRFLWAALGFVLLATGVASFAGHLLARRVARLLAQAAESARTAEGGEGSLAPSEAPEEIRAVVVALHQTLQRIREESESARLLISGLAHELRSPLQNLMGETQVTLLRERESGEYRHVLESHLEDFGALSRVVDNLVTLSSVEEARRQRSVEHFDLAAEARLRLAREQEFARRRGVELRLLLEGEQWVDGDRESLLLALRNVVTNAIEWSPPERHVEVRMGARDNELEIVVDDAGPGVPPEQRENIFRPFHRGPTAKGRRVGFGLGLALTHSAVRAQGGRIEVGDSPSGGARFRILLPLRRA